MTRIFKIDYHIKKNKIWFFWRWRGGLLNLVPFNAGGKAEILLAFFNLKKFRKGLTIFLLPIKLVSSLLLLWGNYICWKVPLKNIIVVQTFIRTFCLHPFISITQLIGPHQVGFISPSITRLLCLTTFGSIYNKFYVSLNHCPVLFVPPLYCLSCHNF